jgi:galactose mutarotase-like enzyme
MSFPEITIQSGDVSATVSPARGGLITGLTVKGKPVLYLDRESFNDPTKNVRGGVPILFPYAGKLIDGVFTPAGTKMGQHGFGRNKPWAVTEQAPSLLRYTVSQDNETAAQYPYDFVAEQTVMVVPRGLHIELLVCNTGRKPLPTSPGWHPYFCCPAGEKNKVVTDVPDVKSAALTVDREFDFGVVAPQTGRAKFTVPNLGKLLISFSPRMRHMQFWSQPGKDFICLEPFTGPNNTVNTDKRVDVPPGEARNFWMRIELE